jgi:hypothetical protein
LEKGRSKEEVTSVQLTCGFFYPGFFILRKLETVDYEDLKKKFAMIINVVPMVAGVAVAVAMLLFVSLPGAAFATSDGEADFDARNLEVLHNPYRSRGASLVSYKTFPHTASPETAFPYFYDDRVPIQSSQRRQRQFVTEPIVLPTTRFASQTAAEDIKELPNRSQHRPGFFFNPNGRVQQGPPPHVSSFMSPQQSHLFQPQQHLFQKQQQQLQFQLEQQQRNQQLLEQQQQQLLEQQQRQQLIEHQRQQRLLEQQQHLLQQQQQQQQIVTQTSHQHVPSLSPFRVEDALTTTSASSLLPTTSFARGTHLKPVPAVPNLITTPEQQQSAPPTESNFSQLRFGLTNPTTRPAAGETTFNGRQVIKVRQRQRLLPSAAPPPTVKTVKVETETVMSPTALEPKVFRVRKPMRKPRKINPVVRIVPVSTAVPIPASTIQSNDVPTVPTVPPTGKSPSSSSSQRSPMEKKSESTFTGFRARQQRPKGISSISGIRSRLQQLREAKLR